MITREVQFFVLATVAVATLTILVLAHRIPWSEWQQLLLFFGTIVAAFSLRIPNPRGGWITPTVVLSFLAIYLLNPPTALLVVGTGGTIGYVISRGWVPWRALFNGSLMALSVAAGASVFALLGGEPWRVNLSGAYAALIAGPLTHQAVNTFIVSFAHSRWRGIPLLSTWFGNLRDLLWPNLLSVPTALVLAVIFVRVHHSAVLAYLVLLPFQWLALRLYVKRRQLYAQIVDGLVVATDVNFPLGRGHARRVAELAVAIAREMRLSEVAIESTQFAALLHDVGMIGKDDLLERPVVSAEDAEGLRDHVRVGAEIAKELPRKEIATLIFRHHERFDGTGYPGSLRGESIPLGARIIALAEAVDSMATGTFPYTSPIPSASILATVMREKARAFDPEVVEAFLRSAERSSLSLASSGVRDQGIVDMQKLGDSPAR